MKFYDPDGNEINSTKEFIEIYSSFYYKEGKTKNNGKKYSFNNEMPSYVSSNNGAVEKKFDGLLDESGKPFSKEDYRDIMAWKIGVIDQNKSSDPESSNNEESSNLELAFSKNGWSEFDYKDPGATVETRYGKLELGKLLKALEDKEFIELSSEEGAQAFLNYLRDYGIDSGTKKRKGISGLGTVYMMTLLYFKSKGEWPIYDKYAAVALLAIENDLKPDFWDSGEDGKITYIVPPSKDEGRFNKVVSNLLVPYKENINKIFDYDEYKKGRNIDRALWVYGHLFKTKKWLYPFRLCIEKAIMDNHSYPIR